MAGDRSRKGVSDTALGWALRWAGLVPGPLERRGILEPEVDVRAVLRAQSCWRLATQAPNPISPRPTPTGGGERSLCYVPCSYCEKKFP